MSDDGDVISLAHTLAEQLGFNWAKLPPALRGGPKDRDLCQQDFIKAAKRLMTLVSYSDD